MRSLPLISFLMLAACGQSEQSVSYKDSEGNDRSISVTENGDTRTVTSDDGLIRATGARGGGNARFPAYAPQYPGSTIQSAVDMNAGTAATGGVKQHVITMLTSDTPDDVIAFYKDKLGSSGKSVKEVKSATGPMLMVGGSSPLDMEAMVTATPASTGGTSVNISLTERLPKS